MATQPEYLDDEAELEQDDAGEAHEPDDEQQDDADAGEGEGEQSAEAIDEADTIEWGEQAVAAEEESEGMRNLRNRLRELDRENRELRGQPKADPVGEKPNIDDYWDKPEQFETDLLAWNERKRDAEARETQQQAAARKQQERWEAQHSDFTRGYGELRVVGKDAALATVEDAFPGEQKAYLIKAAGANAPAFLLALGNNPAKRAELKALADEGSYAEFIAAAAIMSKEIKVTRRPTTQPDTNHSARGTSGAGASAGSKTLDRLEREAAQTNDRSKVIAYKRAQREQGK